MMMLRTTRAWSHFRATGYAPSGKVDTSMSDTESNSTPKANLLSRTAVLVAVASIALWAVASVVLLLNVDEKDPDWTRMAWVFGSIQAIAFAAAGALFGTTVTREQAVAAEDRAQRAEQRAGENEQLATAGRALASSLQAEAVANEAEPGRATGGQVAAVGEGAVDRHARMSRALFGDLI
jgi:hypothetical protein